MTRPSTRLLAATTLALLLAACSGSQSTSTGSGTSEPTSQDGDASSNPATTSQYDWLEPTEDASELAKRDQFAQLETRFGALQADIDTSLARMKSDDPELSEKLKEDLSKFVASMQDLEAGYHELLETTNDPRLALGSVVRIGDMYWIVARYIASVPVPSELSDVELETYQSYIDDYVTQIEGRAIELYTLASAQAARQGIEDHALVLHAETRIESVTP